MGQALIGLALGVGMVGVYMGLLLVMAALEEASSKRPATKPSGREEVSLYTKESSHPVVDKTVGQEPEPASAEESPERVREPAVAA
jgi:DNA mismatch repair ATPase MutS